MNLWSMFGLGITRFFEDDTGEQGGGPGDTPQDPGAGSPEDGGSQDSAEQRYYDIKVNGQPQRVTEEELIAHAQKGLAAEQKFEEASKLKKEADSFMSLRDLTHRAKSGQELSQSEQVRYLELLGYEKQEIDAMMRQAQNGQDDDSQGSDTQKSGKEAAVAKKLSMDDLDENTKEVLQYASKQRLRDIRQSIEDQTREALDKDTELSTIIEKLPNDKREEAKAELFDMAMETVTNRIFQNQEFGPDLLGDVIPRIRARVSRLGIRTPKGDLPLMGDGRIPSGETGFMAIPDKPVERVPSTDPNYEDNVVMRIMQQQRALSR